MKITGEVMVKSKFALLVMTSLIASCVAAETPLEANIKKALLPYLGEGAKIDSIRAVGVADLYEVRAGGDIRSTTPRPCRT